MRLSKVLGSLAVLGAAFMGVASTSFADSTFADTTIVHCAGIDGDTEIEVTISLLRALPHSRFLPMTLREVDLASGREKIVKTVAEKIRDPRPSGVDAYIQVPKVNPYLGFGLSIRNETGAAWLSMVNSPLGNGYQHFPLMCDVF